MFSGIGGFELGIQKACPEAECIGFSEIDKYAVKVYLSHFPTHKNFGDARRIVPEELPEFDMLCGGFPCQAFSIAGKRGGFEDTRGTLFHEIARIARAKRPKLLFLENVKGLLSHDSGRTFGTILSTFSDLGYFLEWQVLNSKDFGVPQNRERVFIVGHLGTPSGRQVFPIGGTDEENHGANIRADKANHGSGGAESDSNDSDGGTSYSKTVRGGGRSSLTKKHNWDSYPVKGRIRRLTPTECERLQGFPDGWTSAVSDSQRYKCLGNAVTVNVIEAIARKMISVL